MTGVHVETDCEVGATQHESLYNEGKLGIQRKKTGRLPEGVLRPQLQQRRGIHEKGSMRFDRGCTTCEENH
jgi:hypothetical protein